MKKLCLLFFVIPVIGACASSDTVDVCSVRLHGDLDAAINQVEGRLRSGCEYQFDGYFQSLLAIAAENPDKQNPMRFSDFLVRVQGLGVISRRQAEALYNRYFNVKFVSMRGDYNTCSQTCPVRDQVLSDMRAELHDKELGLMRASSDQDSFYRADNLLKEADLVLEATCRACAGGSNQ